MAAVRKSGAKLITVDPRYTETAKVSDVWLQIRPATDTALALAWLHVIIEEELYDKDFIEKYTLGFDKVVDQVKDFTPEKAADITWIPADKIVESARLYASSKPATILTRGIGPDQIGRNMLHSGLAMCILRAITGNLDIPGGEILAPANRRQLNGIVLDEEMALNDELPVEQRDKQIGSDRFRLLALPGYELIRKYTDGHPYSYQLPINWGATAHWPTVARAILTGKPYPVRTIICQATNLLLWLSNSRLVYEALKALDLLVVQEVFMTPTAMLADYVLPTTDWMERPFLKAHSLGNVFCGGERALRPEAERQDDYQLWRGLGIRLGQRKYWWDTLEEVYSYRVKPAGYQSYEEFIAKQRVIVTKQEHGKHQKYPFATPSGKVELYSTMLEQLGYEPLPRYEEPAESPVSTPELAKEYPLILITGGKVRHLYHSQYRQIHSARSKHPDPLVQINPDTAKEYGITDGDWVNIETPIYGVRQRARLDNGIHPQVIHAEHGWWFPEDPAPEPSLYGVWKSNINAVLDDNPDKCDPACGSWPCRGVLCKISKYNLQER
ncbi:molybdopterin-dependent oxidoreductase [Chloroflexota bacterium]